MDKLPVKTNNNSIGRGMSILAWVMAIGLLVLVFDDELTKQFNPNEAPESRLTQSGVEVVLKQNRQGHYVTTGKINGKEVVFLIDTGATEVSVPVDLADELGLRGGSSVRLRTANGTVTGYDTQISELSIGNLTVYNVDGHINPGMRNQAILLGMSVLRELEFTQRGDTLILRQL